MSSERKTTEKMSDYLPEEVIIQVLHNLPVKSLIRFTSVCKLWYSLIKNPDFISTHIAKSSSITIKTNPNPLLLYHVYANQYSLGFDLQGFEEYMHFPFKSGSRFFRAVGYSNGLLCIFDRDFALDRYEDKFILWNPSIRKSFTVPQPNFAFPATCSFCCDYIGFGFDSSTNDYKIFRMMMHHLCCCQNVQVPDIQIEIYSFNMNSWKIITDNVPAYWIENHMLRLCPSQKHYTAAYVNNALHWTVSYGKESTEDDDVGRRTYSSIMVFDMKDEVFGEIMLPNCLANHPASGWSVKAFGDSSIAVIGRYWNNYFTHIWVMKEYGVVESWESLPQVDDQKRGRVRILGFKQNGEIILKYFRRQSACPIADAFVDTYVESLALIDKGNVVEKKSPKRGRESNTEIICVDEL